MVNHSPDKLGPAFIKWLVKRKSEVGGEESEDKSINPRFYKVLTACLTARKDLKSKSLQHIASRLKPEVDASLRGTSDQSYNTDLAGLVTNVHNLGLPLLNEKVSWCKETVRRFHIA